MKKWQIGWGAVAECNMACEFCYSKNERIKDGVNLGYNDWVSFIDNNYEYINTINYGTGENTLSPDWFKLIDYIRSNYPDIKQALTTNGFLVEQMIVNPSFYEIAKRSLDEIDVSLDFSNEERYCKFRGNENICQWALGTLRFCQENNIAGTIVFIGGKPVLEKGNIDGLFKIAKDHDAKLRMNIYRPTSPDKKTNDKFIAPYEQIIDILYHIDSKYKILSISDPLFSSILTNGHFEEDPSGISSVRILHNGSITPSTYLISDDFQLCNIMEEKVFKKIEEENIFHRLKLNTIPEECKSCEFCDICRGGVYDRRYLWNKSFAERDPYCPFNEGHFLPDKKVVIHTEEDFDSVHYGYLPTLFFSN